MNKEVLNPSTSDFGISENLDHRLIQLFIFIDTIGAHDKWGYFTEKEKHELWSVGFDISVKVIT